MTIDTSLQAVNDLLLSISKSSVALLSETSAHILGAGGKRLRPRLVLLAHAAVGGDDFERVVPLAAAVEIIHTATLVHDDINDHGTLRRGRETVNSRWGGTFALLTGDYMFTRAYLLMAPFSSELNTILAQAALDLVEGETLQIKAARQGELDRDLYYEIISKKTASLFAAAVELGAAAGNASPEWRAALREYAFNLGLAFQITDDVLDLVADTHQLGKNAGIDVAQGRGIAVALDGNHGSDHGSGSGSDGAAVAALAALSQDTAPGPLKESLIDAGINGDALDAAIQKGRGKAAELAARAAVCLDALPPSAACDELRALADQVVRRDH
ncbi:MAG: polyprenyl synthetase family protein [Anaerolineae bacterium]|nr:polyprenyl synthetase family protein [Anaerolineae bacterium]